MTGVNRAILVGHLGTDPKITERDGRKIASFSLASSHSWKDKETGERKEETEWHRVVVFVDKLAETVEQYLHKGSKVYIEGAIRTRKWTDNSGVDKYTTEIVLQPFRSAQLIMLDKREGGPPEASSEQSYGAKPADFDDEIPF